MKLNQRPRYLPHTYEHLIFDKEAKSIQRKKVSSTNDAGMTGCQHVEELGINLHQDPAIPLLGIYPKDADPQHKDICSTMFIVALFIIAGTWKQPRCPAMEEQKNKMWYIYTQWVTTQQ